MARRSNVERPPLAAMLVRLRTAKGWTQQQLAERSGVSLSFLGMVEAGSRGIGTDTLDSLAAALEVSDSERKTLGRLRAAQKEQERRERVEPPRVRGFDGEPLTPDQTRTPEDVQIALWSQLATVDPQMYERLQALAADRLAEFRARLEREA